MDNKWEEHVDLIATAFPLFTPIFYFYFTIFAKVIRRIASYVYAKEVFFSLMSFASLLDIPYRLYFISEQQTMLILVIVFCCFVDCGMHIEARALLMLKGLVFTLDFIFIDFRDYVIST